MKAIKEHQHIHYQQFSSNTIYFRVKLNKLQRNIIYEETYGSIKYLKARKDLLGAKIKFFCLHAYKSKVVIAQEVS